MAQDRARLCDVNSHLMCVLCGGYYVDATTICECLHSFCRSCIVKHLETSRFCPICDVQLHKNKPLLSIRPDKTLQRLVYKVVPGLYQSELQRRRQFYNSIPDSPECQRDLQRIGQSEFYSPEETISLSLEYHDSSRVEKKKTDENAEDVSEEVQRRYLQCPAAVNIMHLQKFLRMKYGLHHDHRVDIYYHNKLLPETFTLMDVAYTFNWDRAHPMRFGFQILELHAVTVTNKTQVLVAESSPSSSLETNSASRDAEEVRSGQSEQLRDLGLGKKKLRQNSGNVPEESPPPIKKARSNSSEAGRSSSDSERTIDKGILLVGKQSTKSIRNRVQELIDSVKVDDSNDSSEFSLDGKEGSQVVSLGDTEGSTADVADMDAMDADNVSQVADSIEDENIADANQDIEEVVVDVEGEPSQDFALQEDQPMDASEDLDEDDDEDRLRICDPEEVTEEKSAEENADEHMETEPVHPEVEKEKLETLIEEETEVVKKEKSRKKNKKAKHHHRHKRDYSPTPEAAIVPDDTSNVMKLRLKVINHNSESKEGKNRNKQEDGSKHHRLSSDGQVSPRSSIHKNYVIAQDTDNNSIQSPTSFNVDEDSRNSQSTDDHEVRSIGSPKEGQDETHSKKSPLPNGNVEFGKGKNREVSTKEKLLQMRQVRHKNITPPPRVPSVNTTISKVSAEEASKNAQKSPILLSSSSSSLTVSKVTAEEKMMMMTNNNLESKRPSLEIIMVNNPNSISKSADRSIENQAKQKILSSGMPVVKMTKNNQLNSLMQKQQNSLSVSKVKTSGESSKNAESSKNSKDDKNLSERRLSDGKKGDSFGALDLSGKPGRSSGSSPVSDGSNCPSPKQSTLSMSQSLINKHLSASMNSPHRSSNNSPTASAALPKGSPTRALNHPAAMWNLMTLTETAVHIRNIKAQEGMKRQLSNHQKKPSPQRYPAVSSPSKTPSPRASPTQLKIPNPNNISNLANKFINRPKVPGAQSPLTNRVRPIGVNKPMVAMTRPMPSPSPARSTTSFPNMMQSHSAAVAKKQAGINGRNLNIPPPPPAIPISTLYKMESMARKYDLEKIARGLSAASKAAAGIPSS